MRGHVDAGAVEDSGFSAPSLGFQFEKSSSYSTDRLLGFDWNGKAKSEGGAFNDGDGPVACSGNDLKNDCGFEGDGLDFSEDPFELDGRDCVSPLSARFPGAVLGRVGSLSGGSRIGFSIGFGG